MRSSQQVTVTALPRHSKYTQIRLYVNKEHRLTHSPLGRNVRSQRWGNTTFTPGLLADSFSLPLHDLPNELGPEKNSRLARYLIHLSHLFLLLTHKGNAQKKNWSSSVPDLYCLIGFESQNTVSHHRKENSTLGRPCQVLTQPHSLWICLLPECAHTPLPGMEDQIGNKCPMEGKNQRRAVFFQCSHQGIFSHSNSLQMVNLMAAKNLPILTTIPDRYRCQCN